MIRARADLRGAAKGRPGEEERAQNSLETGGFRGSASNASVARRGLFQPLDDVPDNHWLAVCIAGNGLRRLGRSRDPGARARHKRNSRRKARLEIEGADEVM
jgi:hypothetical protein